MEIRKLQFADKAALDNLIAAIENDLLHHEFWLPINDVSRNHFFDKEWTEFYGMFDREKLIGAVALFYNEHEYGESVAHVRIDLGKVAEIGRAMVLPQYRGNNILYKLSCRLLRDAKAKGIHYLLATIHPDNTPSQKSFQKLGMKKYCTYTKDNGFLRDIYLLEL